ncbi:septum formation initiator family protein [Streptomyces sp. NPDC020883]|uniref:septum formation initiator family protein n=1 Tax=Streptomyces sp. NPDC020883 TaxID=3365099 RepID=UPI003793A86C
MTGQGSRPRGRQRLAALLPSPPRGGTAARTPFVLLVVVLLGSGLITLLLLNSALNQGSFELSRLERKTGELTDEQQELQQEVNGYSAPDELARRAHRLGMVPGGNPAFLMPDGTIRGAPGPVSSSGSPSAASAAALPLGPVLRPTPQGAPPASVLPPPAPAVRAAFGPLAASTPGVLPSPGPLAAPAAPASVLTPDEPTPAAARLSEPPAESPAGPTPSASGR